MKTKVGLWIDYRKAVIVFLAGEEEEMKLVSSNVEKQIRRAAGSCSGGIPHLAFHHVGAIRVPESLEQFLTQLPRLWRDGEVPKHIRYQTRHELAMDMLNNNGK